MENPTSAAAPACPGLLDLMRSANENFRVSTRTVDPATRSDTALVEVMFPDWDLLGSTERNPTPRGPRRALLHHREGPWWLLIYTGRLRLLHGREYVAPREFRFTTAANTVVVGSEANVIDHVAHETQTGRWSPEAFLWVLDLMPGSRADAERLLLSFPATRTNG